MSNVSLSISFTHLRFPSSSSPQLVFLERDSVHGKSALRGARERFKSLSKLIVLDILLFNNLIIDRQPATHRSPLNYLKMRVSLRTEHSDPTLRSRKNINELFCWQSFFSVETSFTIHATLNFRSIEHE